MGLDPPIGYKRCLLSMEYSPLVLITLQSINAEIKRLEAQRLLVEKRDDEVPKAIAVLQKYATALAQRRQVAKLIGKAIDVRPASAKKTAAGPLKG